MHLVLIGDIHAYRTWPQPWQLLGKAMLGQLNVWFNRSRRFELARMEPLLARAAGLNPELLVFSGDLTSTATGQEFDDAKGILSGIVGKFPAVMVPGNHDRYTWGSVVWKRMERRFPGVLPESFPQARKLTDKWSLLMLNSSVPRTFTSRGLLGGRQMEAVRDAVGKLTADDGLVLLTHYALGKPQGHRPARWSHRLREHDAMLELLKTAKGRVVFLHGHVHYPWYWEREDLLPARVLDINSGAPCLVTGAHPCGQGFWSIRLPEGVDGPVSAEHHAFEACEGERGVDGWVVTRYGEAVKG
jgi:3',5'-cyclic AMP phosphodiesterase CpdA